MSISKSLKAKWVRALRSGKYLQGRGKLKRTINRAEGPQYCCMGVLREICPRIKATDNNQYLTVKSSGLSDDIQYKLAYYNDLSNGGKGLSFKRIAALIERRKYI